MKRLTLLLCSLSAALTCPGVTHGKEWRGIVPLYSTVDDVERLLGKSPHGLRLAYETEDERVFFYYQSPASACGTTWGRWGVPGGRILSIEVYPKKKVPLDDPGLDLSKYVKSRTCMPGTYHYVNGEEGVYITVSDGIVAGFNYYPAARDKQLACPGADVRQG